MDVPTLVIHGRDDRLLLPRLGERTAEIIPGSKFLLLSDMGHDLPEELWPVLVDSILSHLKNSVLTGD
jgi:pimeloyl-ACP methyl ester carboxylesterase